MSIGGETRMGCVGRDHFARLAEDCNMSPRLVLDRLDGLSGRILPAARELAAALDREWPSSVYAKIIAVVERQLKGL